MIELIFSDDAKTQKKRKMQDRYRGAFLQPLPRLWLLSPLYFHAIIPGAKDKIIRI